MKDLGNNMYQNIRLGEHLNIQPIEEIPTDKSINAAANYLTEIERPFLILEGKDKIVTPGML